MDKLEASLKYVPTYQIIENIRKEEKKIAREKLALEKDKTKSEREQKQKLKKQLEEKEKSMVNFLLEKDISVEQIAKILGMTPKAVEKIISNQSAGI